MSALAWLTLTLGICLIVAIGIIVIAVWRTTPQEPEPLIHDWSQMPAPPPPEWQDSKRPIR